MVKVSKECIKLIEALPEGDIDKVKSECLSKTRRRTGPITEKQKAWRKKFSNCADQSKGKPDYRDRMKECLTG